MVVEHQGDLARARALLEESMEIDRELGDQGGLATSLHNSGRIAHDQGDPAAGTLYEQGLAIYRELGDRVGIVECLEGIAAVLVDTGSPRRAAKLFAAADALRAALGAPLPPLWLPRRERYVSAARARLSDDEWEHAVAEGRGMTIEDVARYAVESEP